MELQITIYCDKKRHAWLREMLEEMYNNLIMDVETKVDTEEIGLPWVWDEDAEGPEAQDGFEISYTIDKDDNGRMAGSSWLLNDYLWQEFPPPEWMSFGPDV